MKAPTTVKEVRRFLGMCEFYRKHVPSFAKIAALLTNLTPLPPLLPVAAVVDLNS